MKPNLIYYYPGEYVEDYPNNLNLSLAFAVKMCKENGYSELTIHAWNLDVLKGSFRGTTFEELIERLVKKRALRFDELTLKVNTANMKFPKDIITSKIVLSIYPTEDMLEKLISNAPYLQILIITPYALSELKTWLKEHNAKPIPVKR